MNWKDKWTSFCWKICFPGVPVPVEILPSYKEPPKPRSEDVLTKLICMDIEMYPNSWVKKYSDDEVLENKSQNILIKFNSYTYTKPDEHCRVNGIEVGKNNGNLIKKAFRNRNMVSILEKLLDRVEKVETVIPEEVKEAVKSKTVDPFSVDHLEQLQESITALQKTIQSLTTKSPLKILLTDLFYRPDTACYYISESREITEIIPRECLERQTRKQAKFQ